MGGDWNEKTPNEGRSLKPNEKGGACTAGAGHVQQGRGTYSRDGARTAGAGHVQQGRGTYSRAKNGNERQPKRARQANECG